MLVKVFDRAGRLLKIGLSQLGNQETTDPTDTAILELLHCYKGYAPPYDVFREVAVGDSELKCKVYKAYMLMYPDPWGKKDIRKIYDLLP